MTTDSSSPKADRRPQRLRFEDLVVTGPVSIDDPVVARLCVRTERGKSAALDLPVTQFMDMVYAMSEDVAAGRPFVLSKNRPGGDLGSRIPSREASLSAFHREAIGEVAWLKRQLLEAHGTTVGSPIGRCIERLLLLLQQASFTDVSLMKAEAHLGYALVDHRISESKRVLAFHLNEWQALASRKRAVADGYDGEFLKVVPARIFLPSLSVRVLPTGTQAL